MGQTTERLLDALYKLIHIRNGNTYTPYKIEDPADVINHLTNERFLNLGSDTIEAKGFFMSLLTPQFFDELRKLEQLNVDAGATHCDVLHSGLICILDYEADINNRKYTQALYEGNDPTILNDNLLYTKIEYFLDSIATLTNNYELTSITDRDKLEYLQNTMLALDLILQKPVSILGSKYTAHHLQQFYDKVQYYNEHHRSNNPSLTDVVADLYHINVLHACEQSLTETDHYTNRSQVPLLKSSISKWSSYTKEQQKNVYVRMINLIPPRSSVELIKSHLDYFSDNAPGDFKKLCVRTILSLNLGLKIQDKDVIQMNLYDETLKPQHLPETLTNAFET